MNDIDDLDGLYPVTIFRARYGGSYEGSDWVALWADLEDFPDDAAGSDVECVAWYANADKHGAPLGRGASPDEALKDLCRSIVASPTRPKGWTVFTKGWVDELRRKTTIYNYDYRTWQWEGPKER